MVTAGDASQPVGHWRYCKINPDDCASISDNAGARILSSNLWFELVDVNRSVNDTVRPATDLETYGVDDLWMVAKDVGDCEDYVLLKRKLLMQNGWPASDLLITIVRQFDAEGNMLPELHAVLTVRTNEGDFVLDNLEPEIRLWVQIPYYFLKRQSVTNSGRWERIDDHWQPATFVRSIS